ncbi:site-2 protease family protein [Candidatus Avoscillospira sp. LCP25S3_F1]|uniref:site-2 protease family protein n=1 Tax=Candidatus Avoscillospira sp. LCP25S3_F1 TaxID=3438825 RepID=UPI003F90EAD8
MHGFTAWLHQLQFGRLSEMLLIVLASLLCITIHETCHGLAAYRLGDPTAKLAGRLTLNPLRHIDLLGLLMMAVARFGWAKPVPVNMNNFKNPKRDMALTALAGPISNILLAWAALVVRGLLMVLLIRRGPNSLGQWLITFTEYVAILSAGLAVFNLIPISPLDGSKVLFAVLPSQNYAKLMHYERYGMLLLMVVLLAGWLDGPLYYLRTGLLNLLQPLALWPAELLLRLR